MQVAGCQPQLCHSFLLTCHTVPTDEENLAFIRAAALGRVDVSCFTLSLSRLLIQAPTIRKCLIWALKTGSNDPQKGDHQAVIDALKDRKGGKAQERVLVQLARQTLPKQSDGFTIFLSTLTSTGETPATPVFPLSLCKPRVACHAAATAVLNLLQACKMLAIHCLMADATLKWSLFSAGHAATDAAQSACNHSQACI